jgi:hypothetical protein
LAATARASFNWLDHDDEEAKRVIEAMRAATSPGMLDPLGFGAIRDTISDALFPGISTVQTRARYYLMVPWIYQRIEREKVTPRFAGGKIEEWEKDLIESLLRGSDDLAGIIGQERKRDTKQLPSEIYWGGLGRFGIRKFSGSRREYLVSLSKLRAGRRQHGDRDDLEEQDHEGPWHEPMPEAPADLWRSATLEMLPGEASFLADRIRNAAPRSYLAFLLDHASPDRLPSLPWDCPDRWPLPDHLSTWLDVARRFSLVSWGANLTYNSLLSDAYVADGGAGFRTSLGRDLDAWANLMVDPRDQMEAWCTSDKPFWDLLTTANWRVERPRHFTQWWLGVAPQVARDRLAGRPIAGTVAAEIARRELLIKTRRARLTYPNIREATEGPQGDDRMVFRWNVARDIVRDILTAAD